MGTGVKGLRYQEAEACYVQSSIKFSFFVWSTRREKYGLVVGLTEGWLAAMRYKLGDIWVVQGWMRGLIDTAQAVCWN